MKVVQEGDLSKSETFTITVSALGQGEVNGGLRLRLPDWLAGNAVVTMGLMFLVQNLELISRHRGQQV